MTAQLDVTPVAYLTIVVTLVPMVVCMFPRLNDASFELTEAYHNAQKDPEFQKELDLQLREFAGRPTNLYYADRLTQHCGGAKIYLKREDILHTGAHKINNALGQALLAKRMGKSALLPRQVRGSTV